MLTTYSCDIGNTLSISSDPTTENLKGLTAEYPATSTVFYVGAYAVRRN